MRPATRSRDEDRQEFEKSLKEVLMTTAEAIQAVLLSRISVFGVGVAVR